MIPLSAHGQSPDSTIFQIEISDRFGYPQSAETTGTFSMVALRKKKMSNENLYLFRSHTSMCWNFMSKQIFLFHWNSKKEFLLKDYDTNREKHIGIKIKL